MFNLSNLCRFHDRQNCSICKEMERRMKEGGVAELEKFLKLDIETFLDSPIEPPSSKPNNSVETSPASLQLVNLVEEAEKELSDECNAIFSFPELQFNIEKFLDNSSNSNEANSLEPVLIKKGLEECDSSSDLPHILNIDTIEWEKAEPVYSKLYQKRVELKKRILCSKSLKSISKKKLKKSAATIKTLVFGFINLCDNIQENNENSENCLVKQADLLLDICNLLLL